MIARIYGGLQRLLGLRRAISPAVAFDLVATDYARQPNAVLQMENDLLR
jgi:hypothetical protein